MSATVAPVSREQWNVFFRRHGGEEGLREPAGESALADLESRLGRVLPTDYRNFLLTTDGCDDFDPLYRMWPAAEVGWAREALPGMIEAWEDFEDVVGMLRRCVVVGDDESNSYYLLDPGPGPADWAAIEWWTTPTETTEYSTFGDLVVGLVSEDA